ncbi:MAG: TonB-dependent receptor [Flavobacteriaceae bacterium]|nr:TonB-dependent receptor [Flavobacteriaceae bacterium]
MKTLFIPLILVIFCSQAQETTIKKDTIKLDEVLVTATRANKKDPFTKSTISKKELEKQNLGQDIPQLLQMLPNVVTTSDAGAGVGYTGIRVRGSDASRVNVTINGIPLNDSESQNVFWVNLPDFVSSVESIQLQRGVGTSTNGASAFGASLSLATEGVQTNAFTEIDNIIGSFNTRKHNLKFGTGTLHEYFNFSGRISTIQSDGYIDRASSDLRSLYLEANYTTEKTSIKALAFGGSEVTYQAWYGIDKTTLENNRTYNPAGEIRNEFGEVIDFYDNQVDSYKQDHYQLHFNRLLHNNWTANIAVHYTYGRGFFEEFKQREDFNAYGLTPININGVEINQTDLVRRKWLKNDFYGTTFSIINKTEKTKLIIGGAYNKYDGDHFGEVIWATVGSSNNSQRYYDNTGIKKDFNIFTKIDYKLNEIFNLFGDLQYRNLDYSVNGIDEGPMQILINDTFNFFNPKAGINVELNTKNSFYLSYARANKEPKRADYESEKKPESEQLDDIELGWRFKYKKAIINANMYYMYYKNQLVLTGALNNVGTPIANNIGKSFRLGLEIDAKFSLLKNKLFIQPNLALSTNKNIDKFENLDGQLQGLGNTNLSFSPEIVASSLITYTPFLNFEMNLQSKYVGDQFMSNLEEKSSILDAYSVTNLQFQYSFRPQKIVKEIIFKTLVNNIFNKQYESNGYFYSYDDTSTNPGETTTMFGAGYYPQAGVHFLTGVTIKF